MPLHNFSHSGTARDPKETYMQTVQIQPACSLLPIQTSNYSEDIRQPLPLGVGISGKQLLMWEAIQKHALSTISFLKSSIDILQESCHNYQYESGTEDMKKLPSEVLHPGTCCRHLVQAHELHSSHHSSNITHFSCEWSRRNSLPAEWGNKELSTLQFASQAAKWLATSFVF